MSRFTFYLYLLYQNHVITNDGNMKSDSPEQVFLRHTAHTSTSANDNEISF